MAKKAKKSLKKAGDAMRAKAAVLRQRADDYERRADEIDACGSEETFKKLQRARRMREQLAEIEKDLKGLL